MTTISNTQRFKHLQEWFTSSGMKCWTARLNTVGLLCASVLKTWIFADFTTLSMLFNSSVTLASFHQQRADHSSFKTTMSPTLMDCSIAPVLFRWYSRNTKRYSLRHCLVKPSSNLKWYLALFINDWNVLMTLHCLWCGMVAIWRPYITSAGVKGYDSPSSSS